ncbi:PREDICTED: uncharacterized protein LOC106818871 [Priapulus caudatus]|uniref:Uncharacterized protein LOC106818871 n=1 Tax=Priapulus caudatus TaxID=37621 RepID=A0ABM1F3K9_PRICU|nr:PREDICTED: uncharacterized protein LOC106818871 [Priapulus caudatus]XP_014679037.1 PREDICTED: uncharacterized protein LOC106818871 [Priapulus caudatus]
MRDSSQYSAAALLSPTSQVTVITSEGYMLEPMYASIAMSESAHPPLTQTLQDENAQNRFNNIAICCHVSVSIPLIVVGFFILVYAVLGRISVESPEGSLYFIGPILILAGAVFCCRVSMLRKRFLEQAEQTRLPGTNNNEEELPAHLIAAMIEPPPSYETVMAQPPRTSPVVSVTVPPPDRHVDGSAVVSPLSTIDGPALAQSANAAPASGAAASWMTNLALTGGALSWTAADYSSSSSSSDDAEPLPPTYEEYVRASQLSIRAADRPPPPSYTSLALSEPDLCRVSAATDADAAATRPRSSTNDASMLVRTLWTSHNLRHAAMTRAKAAAAAAKTAAGARDRQLSQDCNGDARDRETRGDDMPSVSVSL